MQTHSLPWPLENSGLDLRPESSALWASKPPKSLVVFVHGFSGRAVETWGEFRDMIPQNRKFASCDVVFLGYESVTRSAPYNAGVLYRTLTALVEEYPRFVRTSGAPIRRRTFKYNKIVLVGHSLGGVLVRDIAMSVATEGKSWSKKISLMLFAPAHMGANVISLANEAVGFVNWVNPIRAVAHLISPSLKDLKEGSRYLTALLKRARALGRNTTTKARIVVHGSRDRIVVHDAFYLDPPCRPYDRHNHTSCCKPIGGSFENPVLDLVELLQR